MFQCLIFFLVTSSAIAAEVSPGSSTPTSTNRVTSDVKAKEVLTRYGYLQCGPNPCDKSALLKAVRNYQMNYGLSVTGRLDSSTLHHLGKARCGNVDDRTSAVPYRNLSKLKERRDVPLPRKDPKTGRHRGRGRTNQRRIKWINERTKRVENGELDLTLRPLLKGVQSRKKDIRRQKRSSYDGQAYISDVVTWRLVTVGHSSQMPATTQRAVLGLAFRMWAEVVPLLILEDNSSPVADVDILVAFGRGEHRTCPHHFDGRGGQLSHAVRLETATEIHFDDDEAFSLGNQGKNLVQIALHEVGHTLGLFHSRRNASAMYAIHSAKAGLELSWEDRAIAQSIYGVCRGTFDTAFDLVRHKSDGRDIYNTYFFRGDHYWMYENRHRRTRYGDPLKIAERWNGVPSNLDAFAHVWNHDRDDVYFFKGRHVWLLDNDDQIMPGFPREISEHFRAIPDSGFPSIPVHIDSAFFDKRDGNLYFFKGYLVYAYNISRGEEGCCLPGYPRLLDQEFPPVNGSIALPRGLDAVYYSYTDMAMYFFKRTMYWTNDLFNVTSRERQNQVSGPRDISSKWYDICEAELS